MQLPSCGLAEVSSCRSNKQHSPTPYKLTPPDVCCSVYVVRQGVTSWFIFNLIRDRVRPAAGCPMHLTIPFNQLALTLGDLHHMSFPQTPQGIEGADAAFRISGLELGGLLGSLSAGAISDRLIRGNTSPDVGNVGLRVKVGHGPAP
jgi:MFS transporter, OPA family, sugar phosphate sensor protein UhpC